MDEYLNQQLDLPPEVSHYNFRLAGHTHVQDEIKLGLLKHNNGNILKPMLKEDLRSIREVSFYQQISENFACDPVLNVLKSFIPSFYGTWETTINNTNIKYMCIEDLCGKFQNPSVLDIKIGPITYDAFATKEKIKKDTEKYPPLAIFGFRILGMKVYDHCKQLYVSTNKAFGISLKTADDVNAGLGRFYNNKLGQINCLIASGLYHLLMQLKHWFLEQRKFIFISTSILFVYEGNLSPWLTWINEKSLHVVNPETCKQSNTNSLKEHISIHYNDCSPVFPTLPKQSEQNDICTDCNLHKNVCSELQNNCPLIRMSMIDFAHVFPSFKEDSNYLFGLNNLLSYWQQLMKTLKETYAL